MKRRTFLWSLPALLAGCGDAMRGSVVVAGAMPAAAGAAGFAGSGVVSNGGNPYDPLQLTSAGLIDTYIDISQALTLNTAMLCPNNGPAITLSGALQQDPLPGLRIQCRSSTTFDWSVQDGWGWFNGIGDRAQTIPNGGTFALGDTGITAHFAAGTYSSSHDYRGTVALAENLGPLSGRDLDNVTVYPSRGPKFERWGCNNRLPRMYRHNEAGTAPGILGNEGSIASLVTGNAAKQLEIWIRFQVTSSNTSTQSVCLFDFANNARSDDYLLLEMFGPDVEPGANQRFQLRRKVAGGSDVTAVFNQPIDNSWHVLRLRIDGTNATMWFNGVRVGSPVAWTTGLLTCNRFLLGGMLHGAYNASTNTPSKLMYGGVNRLVAYAGLLSADQALENWRCFS